MTKTFAFTIRTLCLIVSCSFFSLSGRAYADTVIFDDFGTGTSYDCCTAYGLNTLAVSFTSTDNIAVSQIDLAIYYLGHVGTTNAATVSLVTNPTGISGDPLGMALGTWSITDLPTGWNGANWYGNVETINGITGINLKAGNFYYLLVSAEGNETIGWNFNSTGTYGTILWGGSLRVDQNPLPAFDILGHGPPAVPEPSTWAMLLIGFAGIGFMAYRRTAKACIDGAAA